MMSSKFFHHPQRDAAVSSRGECRQYASLSKEQKEKLSEGPSLEDFISGDLPQYEGEGSIKRVKGQRCVCMCAYLFVRT